MHTYLQPVDYVMKKSIHSPSRAGEGMGIGAAKHF
jgi:hypothetical protein